VDRRGEDVTDEDRRRWDRRHSEEGVTPPGPPRTFAGQAHLLPSQGRALDVACGRGTAAVWLAVRGLQVHGVDVSPVAIHRAGELAALHGVADRCRFEVADLDAGLPDGPLVQVLLCHLFRDPGLYPAMADRLAPGGVIAVAAQSEVGAGPGRFRAPAGELRAAFGRLEVLADGEGEGVAWIIARRQLA
jgi:2-polyprenyl-3-methyl-5-hydroxy-6-metoxy-1,4-benzoquinol methylase